MYADPDKYTVKSAVYIISIAHPRAFYNKNIVYKASGCNTIFQNHLEIDLFVCYTIRVNNMEDTVL